MGHFDQSRLERRTDVVVAEGRAVRQAERGHNFRSAPRAVRIGETTGRFALIGSIGVVVVRFVVGPSADILQSIRCDWAPL